MIQVIHRAFDIIELCAKNPDKTHSLSDIADKFELNHGTCANIMKTLVLRKYIEQVGHKKGYRLGSMAYHLTGNFSYRKDLVKIARKPMQELVEELNETCLLSVLRKTDLKRIVLHEVYSNQELSVRTTIEKDAYNAATGRLLLAFLPEKEINAVIDKFGLPDRVVWPEATDRESIIRELSQIREDGLAIQYDRNHIVGLAIPVFKEEETVASLSVYMPEMRYRGDMKDIALSRLKQAAQEINKSLAGFGSKI